METLPTPDVLSELLTLVQDPGLSTEARRTLSVVVDAARCFAAPAEPALWPADERPELAPGEPALRFLELLGVGGMGEVWAGEDLQLGCVVAVKVIRGSAARNEWMKALFLHEARLTARLQHPGIVPVHRIGLLDDGRPYYTMKRVEGQPLDRILAAFERGEGGWTARGLVQVLHRACEAVGYAHRQGVVHRDLKPANLRVGGHGEVIVLDWGIARHFQPDDTPQRAGTIGFMAPEVSAESGPATPRSDVYALGIMLGMVLKAAPASGPGGVGDKDGELEGIARMATREAPEARQPDAAVLAEAVGRWLDGAQRRDRALELVARADELATEAGAMRAEAEERRRWVAEHGEYVHPWVSTLIKQPFWEAEDRAADRERRAELAEVERVQALNAALTYVPDLPEAHSRLATWFRAQHEAAETRGDASAAAGFELQLRAHDRGEHRDYLDGTAWLSLTTVPAGASVLLERYVERGRRLVAVPERELGHSPLERIPLAWGSWRLRVRAPGYEEALLPVALRRLEALDACPGGLLLLQAGELPAHAVYVPGGWSRFGGDPEAITSAPTGTRLVPGFVMTRFPVTNAEYLGFLNDLAARGDVEAALRLAPRGSPQPSGEPGALLVRWERGRFTLGVDAEGHRWEPDVPVVMVDSAGARAYAAWRAERDGLPWRLPREDEWERAARGADGRVFPWGDHLDPTWARFRKSYQPGEPFVPRPIGLHPEDESPFGSRDLAGGVRDWCENVWGGDAAGNQDWPALRGGAWMGHATLSRAASRSLSNPAARGSMMGFRLVYPVASASASSSAASW